jgi:hypothetical protein
MINPRFEGNCHLRLQGITEHITLLRQLRKEGFHSGVSVLGRFLKMCNCQGRQMKLHASSSTKSVFIAVEISHAMALQVSDNKAISEVFGPEEN